MMEAVITGAVGGIVLNVLGFAKKIGSVEGKKAINLTDYDIKQLAEKVIAAGVLGGAYAYSGVYVLGAAAPETAMIAAGLTKITLDIFKVIKNFLAKYL